MVKLCIYYQKQFIRVLNDLYIEFQLGIEDLRVFDFGVMDVFICNVSCVQLGIKYKEKDVLCFNMKFFIFADLFVDLSGFYSFFYLIEQVLKEFLFEINFVDGRENVLIVVQKDFFEFLIIKFNFGSLVDSFILGYFIVFNFFLLNFYYIFKSLEG